jgi:hypothetical protein
MALDSSRAATSVITGRRIVISLLLAGCLALFVWGQSHTRPSVTPVIYTDRAIQALEPQPGALALRQERIGVTLTSDYTLAQSASPGLVINGRGIPQDQIEVTGLNQYSYLPGPGKDVTSLPPGRNCATIMIKRATDPTDNGHRFSWCFNSH